MLLFFHVYSYNRKCELSNQLQTLLDNSKYIGTAKGLNDYTFELGNCSYDGGEATFKLKVLIKGSKSRNAWQRMDS